MHQVADDDYQAYPALWLWKTPRQESSFLSNTSSAKMQLKLQRDAQLRGRSQTHGHVQGRGGLNRVV